MPRYIIVNKSFAAVPLPPPLQGTVKPRSNFILETEAVNVDTPLMRDLLNHKILEIISPVTEALSIPNTIEIPVIDMTGSGLDPEAHRLLPQLTHDVDRSNEEVPTFDAEGVITDVVIQLPGGGTIIRESDMFTADADGLITGFRIRQWTDIGVLVETLTGVVTITAGFPTKLTVTRT